MRLPGAPRRVLLFWVTLRRGGRTAVRGDVALPARLSALDRAARERRSTRREGAARGSVAAWGTAGGGSAAHATFRAGADGGGRDSCDLGQGGARPADEGPARAAAPRLRGRPAVLRPDGERVPERPAAEPAGHRPGRRRDLGPGREPGARRRHRRHPRKPHAGVGRAARRHPRPGRPLFRTRGWAGLPARRERPRNARCRRARHPGDRRPRSRRGAARVPPPASAAGAIRVRSAWRPAPRSSP